MTKYHVKQKFKLGGESFTIKDDSGRLAYQVKGSFLKIPKTFEVFDSKGNTVSRLVKPLLTFLPRFNVEMADGQTFTIQKKITFFRDRYTIQGLGLEVVGSIWDLSFRLVDQDGDMVAKIDKKIFNLTSTYDVDVRKKEYADLIISLVVAIDYVEMLEGASKGN